MTPAEAIKASRKVRLLAEIGRGGMAEVYLAVVQGPLRFKKLVVLKRALPELCKSPDAIAMFLDEGSLAARLNHPNVVQTYEIGRKDDRYFITMEYLDGQPLHRIRARLRRSGLPLTMEIRILIEALAGLHHAHELTDFDGTPLHVVHRDATPQNIFVTYDGQIKVVDFGIAKAALSASVTHTGVIKGKMAYLSPEQARGERVDRRADLFAVGVMLWEALVGQPMWRGINEVAIIHRLSQDLIPSLPADAPDIDPELARICQKALSPAPADRYPTASALQLDLERWLVRQGEEVTARAVGALVAASFARERAQIKERIEQVLRAHRRSFAPPEVAEGSLPRINADTLPFDQGPPSKGLVPQWGSARQSRALPHTPVSQSPETLRISSVSVDALAELRPAPRPRSRSRSALTIGSALLLAGATALIAWTLGAPSAWIRAPSASVSAPSSPAQGQAALVSASPPRSAPSAVASAPAALGEVDLRVRVFPITAQLFLDGAKLSTGPYSGKLPKDGRVHRLRAEAPRFVPKEQAIIASAAVVVTLALEREGPPAPRP